MAQTVEMRIGNAVHQVTLNDNAAARSFAARLPLTLQFDDYAGTERIAYLNSKLMLGCDPTLTTPKTCFLTFFNPFVNYIIKEIVNENLIFFVYPLIYIRMVFFQIK